MKKSKNFGNDYNDRKWYDSLKEEIPGISGGNSVEDEIND